MKNIILFFLLLASSSAYAQYWKKHQVNGHLYSALQKPNTFSLKMNPPLSIQRYEYNEMLYSNKDLQYNDQSLSKNFNNWYLEDQYLEGDKPLHSTFVYDLRGNVVTSKLSYSFKKKR